MIRKYDGIESKYSYVLVSGAMQTRYDQFHPLVQFLVENWGNVYSLCLPGHGDENDFIDKSPDHSVLSVLDLIYYYIDNYVPKENLIVVAYSIGGLMIMKLVSKLINRTKNIKFIFIGSALRLRKDSSNLIRRFFNITTYKKLGWEQIMEKQHGNKWKRTVELINSWIQSESDLFPNENDINTLKEHSEEVIWIISTNDQLFNTEDITVFTKEFEIRLVNYDHFSYFLIKKAWPDVQEIINDYLVRWCKI